MNVPGRIEPNEIIVFVGPTLDLETARSVLDALYLPPVSQGDVYCAARRRVWGIGIIDGYFERIPSVWHKEILWAMSRGVHLFGSASMGALRAAELAPFGMVGVGHIFEAFASGQLEDDDEVAILHGPSESGFRPISEALVNIRSTLDKAVSAGVIPGATAQTLLTIARGLNYRERFYSTILSLARQKGISEEHSSDFADWIEKEQVDQKREDALEMLRLMKDNRRRKPDPLSVRFTFSHTDMWQALQIENDQRSLDWRSGSECAPPGGALEELRLATQEFQQVRQSALLRMLALRVAPELDGGVDGLTFARELRNLRRDLDLNGEEAFQDWLSAQGLSQRSFERLVRDELRLRRVLELAELGLDVYLYEELKIRGAFSVYDQRAIQKHETLFSNGISNPRLEDVSLTESELWEWFFVDRCQSTVPEDLELEARRLGFRGTDQLRRALVRERCFFELTARA